ncbi:MAG TPA: hypothetical protein VFX65_05430 [Candidatus Limnocylindrales bacterium]|nr:hypothetical protein [Candidatus Limnocylindrales bacterium]
MPWTRLLVGVLAAILAFAAFQALNRPEPDADTARLEAMFEGLPADVRDEIAGDLETLVGDRFDGLTSEEVVEEGARLTRSGLARLDDESLVRRLELQTLALGRVPTADCAAFMRGGFAGGSVDTGIATRVLTALDEDELIEWYRITARAMRAELEGMPARRSVTEPEFQAAFAPIAATWSPDEVELVELVSADPVGVTDDQMCRFVDLVYGRIDVLDRDQLAVVSLYDINPTP